MFVIKKQYLILVKTHVYVCTLNTEIIFKLKNLKYFIDNIDVLVSS